MMAKALVVIADGIEEMETVIITDILTRGGIEVTLASVAHQQVVAARGLKLVADVTLSEVQDLSFDMIVCPGGLPGAKNLRDSALLTGLLEKQNRQQQWLAAICASPAFVLAHHGLLEGRRATCYPGCEEMLPEHVEEDVVVDGHIITSQGPGTAMAFALKLVEVLAGDITAKEVASQALID